MSQAEHYAYRVLWSAEDDGYVGLVAEMPSLSWVADSPEEAFTGIRQLAAEVVADMATTDETPPEPIADRSFSGKFMVRIPPESHRRLVLDAAEQHVSVNRLVAARLAA
jgi:predicted HicB family RNase H-like nuclease